MQFEMGPLVPPTLAYGNGGISRASDRNPTEPPASAGFAGFLPFLSNLGIHLFQGMLPSIPTNGQPLASAKQRLQIALYFLFAKNLLEPIKRIPVAGETVPFLFVVIVVVFNLGCSPKVCSMSEQLCSAF